ncbi:phage tail assembly chaperone [Candidatus Pelagibacter sp.]|nr:phage tail assembly chaperone [Candidatus Pelagibacter sp.]
MTIAKAIKKINVNAEFTYLADDINSIQWLNGTTPISKADIEAQFAIVEFDMAMEDLRAKRNKLLADTDFHALSDNTMSSDMTTYRQELRDITNGITTVAQANAVVFPTKP